MAITQENLVIMRTEVLIAISKTALAINRLDTWLKQNELDQQFTDIEDEKLELEGELMRLYAKLHALKLPNGRLKPPDDTKMQHIEELSNQVENLMRDQATADVLISLTGRVLALCSEVQALGKSDATG